MTLTRERHAKYGDTLFHLEPNIKECPGGLRDANVCGWLAMLRGADVGSGEGAEFAEAMRFLAAVRCFLHFRHERDDNVLDWQAQDARGGGADRAGRVKPVAASPMPSMRRTGCGRTSATRGWWSGAWLREMEARGLAADGGSASAR